jgi:hypothetical protein
LVNHSKPEDNTLKKIFPIILVVTLIVIAAFMWSCSKDSKNPAAPTPPATTDNASGTVRSDTSGVITTAGGARIVIPVGAVPRTSSDGVGTMVFSIERTTVTPPTLPTGQVANTPVYRFGPEGFVFAAPVEVSIPVNGTTDPGNVAIYRINPTTNLPEYYGGVYDSARHCVVAQTYEFSEWFGAGVPTRSTAWGALQVNNNSGTWVSVCVGGYALTYDSLDHGVIPELGMGSTWAPAGETGWTNSGLWFLPQGTYQMCVQYRLASDPFTYGHVFRSNIVIDHAWNRTDSPTGIPFDIGTYSGGESGMCTCVPTPTHSVGTGDIQVTLSWFNEDPGIDLDLYVIEPGRTDSVCYFRRTTASGGELDLDNMCGNYVNGRPENIYWTQTPPNGQYLVRVNFYSSCGPDTVNAFNVRTVVNGVTRTFAGSVSQTNEWMDVTSFTIAHASVEFSPEPPHYVDMHPALPPKQ